MREDNRPLVIRTVVALLLLIILSVCFAQYKSTGQFRLPQTANPTTGPVIINDAVLRNWLPPVSYDYVTSRLGDYVRANKAKVTYMEVQGDVNIQNEQTYDFTLLFMPQDKQHVISVKISNFDSIISTAVSIGGTAQGYGIPSPSTRGTVLNGVDSLISQGVTAVQGKTLETAFRTFAPSATSVNIQTSTVRESQGSDNGSSVYIYTFGVKVDKKNYAAQFETKGLISSRLILRDAGGKQVYDSGFVDR